MQLRPCAVEDLPAVARLFGHVFRHAAGEPPSSLIDHLREVYFDHPWRDVETPSHVYVSEDGAVDGFIGVLPLRLRFAGRPVRAAVAGALMVREPAERPMAGARLIRSFMAGPQTLSMGDTANWTSKTLWEKLGGRTLPLASMEWVKSLKPVQFALVRAGNRLPSALRVVLKPLSAMAGLQRARGAQDAGASWAVATVDDRAFLDAFRKISTTLDVALDLDEVAGPWFLAQAARKTRHGELFRRVVTDRAGKPIGCYLIYGRKGAPAQTLQLVAAPRHAEAVLASVFAFAAELGCCAVRGQSQKPFMDALFKAGCWMRHACATVVDTDDLALMAALEAGSAPFGGLFGETWMRLVSDDFA